MADTLEIIGKHFGYPECCINSFRDTLGAVGNQLGAEAGNMTGFIPCPTHAKQILNNEIKLEDLIKDRKHSLAFPKDNVNLVLDELKEELNV